MSKDNEQVAVENVNQPGQVSNVNAAKYNAMREAMLMVIPRDGDGVTHKEMARLVKPLLPEDVFPGGEKAMWWSKTVQLDLEAKGLLKRRPTKPMRWVQT